MARNLVFKADQGGLIMKLDDECNFAEIKQSLRKKFDQGERFFKQDMIVKINLGNRCLSQEEKKELLEIFKELQGVSVVEFINNKTTFNPEFEEDRNTLLIKRTLRSGQSISFDGNIAVQGDVNPGAEITAGKDILVLGEVRGIAHAGASGDVNSTIAAFRLKPLQLRIANYISRAPDDNLGHPDKPEIAFVQDEQIIIDYLK